MRHVNFDPDTLAPDQRAWWDAWSLKAAEATREIVEKWEQNGTVTTADFKNNIWSDLKRWLLANVFHGKCAYCEVHIAQARQSGDAEHYRPKGAVNRRLPGRTGLPRVRVKAPDGSEIDHPGYFWLAYNWRNLLPSCRRCNSEDGKKNQFPVTGDRHVFLVALTDAEAAAIAPQPIPCATSPGYYFLPPAELDRREKPLLLHPCYGDDPREHLKFGTKGIEAAKELADGEPSPLGLSSIDVYNLSDDDLRRSRDAEQRRALMKVFLAMASAVDEGLLPDDCRDRARQKLQDWVNGSAPFSAAVLDAYEEYCRGLR